MSTKYSQHFTTKVTPQTQAVPGKNQVANNAGGFVFQISPLEQLKRFLILGAEGGTYYATEQKLTVDNAKNVIKCIQENGVEAVQLITNVAENNRAAKADPAIFALALAASFGNAATKKEAYDSIVKVCRTGTQLFTFCQNIQDLRGWSRGLRNGVSKFYNNKSADDVAYQVIKYRQRNGWTHRDVLRLAHVNPKTTQHSEVLKYAVGKNPEPINNLVRAFETVQKLGTTRLDLEKAIELIKEHRLPWEALPTQMLNEKAIWNALLPSMGLTALIRNLGKMTSIGVIDSNLDANTKLIVSRLTNEVEIKKAGIHPFNVLNALKTYASGKGHKGSLTWSPVSAVVTALDKAFYLAFANVEATGKNIYLGLDVSGSMSAEVMNSNVTCREAVGALAMLTINKEVFVEVRGFTSGTSSRYDTEMNKLDLTPGMNLPAVCNEMYKQNFGRTDCALPILDATKRNLKVDTFIIYTDNETYAGSIHPYQALEQYRKKINPEAKLIVVGMTSTGFSIANPTDKGMLDVVGFDSAAPALMNMFIKGEI